VKNGIRGDLEGVALSYDDSQVRYLTVSDQGFEYVSTCFRWSAAAAPIDSRSENAQEKADGIEVVTRSFGPQFPAGFFACHSNQKEGCPILIHAVAKAS